MLVVTPLASSTPFYGPASPTGYRSRYYTGGTLYWLTMNALFLCGSQWGLGLYNAGILFDFYGELLASLNLLALVLCLLLYVKGLTAPASDDSGRVGGPIFDYYWGTELHPRFLIFDVKQLTNCRFGMTWWGIAVVSFAAKQYEITGSCSNELAVSALLQWVYLSKFFLWETGYFCSMDVQHDRAGFYICWGCLVWVPAVYTLSSHTLVLARVDISGRLALFFLLVGLAAIWINYAVDAQRQKFRLSDGRLNIWGRPARFISAPFASPGGGEGRALLLASGWWAISRHFHYVPEVVAALMWTPPCQAKVLLLPYFYVVFLSILLLHRAGRDDLRCSLKYGKAWTEYCKFVPYQIVPYIF
eukprot:GHVT01061298.1.p1 GENE.GHVT01061298.1~~GHVT01061298.1.p1  ORF type:complete len:359 (+),score=50.73 GHVT01061298.1:802-1878(+)